MKSPPQFQKASQVVPVFNGYSQLVLPLVLRLFFQQTSTSPTLECRHLFRLPRGHVSQMILMLSMPHRMRKIIKKYLSLSLSIYIYIYIFSLAMVVAGHPHFGQYVARANPYGQPWGGRTIPKVKVEVADNPHLA